MLINFFSKNFPYIIIAIFMFHLSQRKYPHSAKKQRATLLWAADLILLYFMLTMIPAKGLPTWTEWIALLIAIAIAIVMRKKFFPFKRHCPKCGKKIDFDKFIGCDKNLCQDCYWEEYPEEAEAERKRTMTAEERVEYALEKAQSVDDIPWESWEPTERCVLTYLFSGEDVLLIEKKRGMGTGYINAPGGHIELEETKIEAAIRETKEETGLDVSDLKEMGTLYFQFKDGIRMLGYVFFAYSHSGELIDECDETKPFWCKVSELDYSRMWEDDILWLPPALEGKKFEGYFLFDGNDLLDSKVILEEDDE